MTLIMYILRLISGADPGFQVRGDGLKENCDGRENFGGISCEKSRGGGVAPGTPPGASIQKLINIDRSKTGRNFGINLKEVIDRFIWTIELCHIF
jgi:hypothetical protein